MSEGLIPNSFTLQQQDTAEKLKESVLVKTMKIMFATAQNASQSI